MAFNTKNIHISKEKLFSRHVYCCSDHLYLSIGSGNAFLSELQQKVLPRRTPTIVYITRSIQSRLGVVLRQSADLFCFTKSIIASFCSGLTVDVLETRERDLAFPFEVFL